MRDHPRRLRDVKVWIGSLRVPVGLLFLFRQIKSRARFIQRLRERATSRITLFL